MCLCFIYMKVRLDDVVYDTKNVIREVQGTGPETGAEVLPL